MGDRRNPMTDTDQHAGEALVPLFIDDGFAPFTAQFTESFDLGNGWPADEILQRMREILELGRAHPIGIGAAGNRCGERAKVHGRTTRDATIPSEPAGGRTTDRPVRSVGAHK
jgi:hypothetical protein